MLPCRNGLLHLPTGKLLPPTPRFFSPNALDYDYDPNAPEPRLWLRFLAELWSDDPQSIGTLRDWFGYMLTPDTKQQKIMMLVGPKRGGKGVIGRVLRGLLGDQNVCNPTLAGLGTNFGLEGLVAKTAATISDARLSGRTDLASVTERLLSISGEDGVDIGRKYLPPLTGCRLPVRFTILTNELPKLTDSSGALVGRLIILRMCKSWYGSEDRNLTDKLLAEKPGILRWAIEGWRHLHERGHFEQPQSGQELRQTMEDLSSPIGAFLRQCCEVGPNYEADPDKVYEFWRAWCQGIGKDNAGEKNVFSRDLHAVVPELKTKQRREGGRMVRYYCGIRIKV
jgi:putative DNA primase/helicase